MIGYVKGRQGTTGIFNSEGDLSKKQIAVLRDSLQNTNSVIWDGLISFKTDYGLANCGSKAKANKLLKDNINQFFDDAGLESNNMNWYASYHTNTDNPHIHFVFWEKAATTDKYKLPVTSFDKLKERIVFGYRDNDTSWTKLRDPIIKAVAHDVKKKVPYYEACYLKKILSTRIDEGKSIQFNRMTDYQKQIFRRFYHQMLGVPEVKEQYDHYKENLHKQDLINKAHFSDEKIFNLPKEVLSFYGNRLNDLETRCINHLIKTMSTTDIKAFDTELYNPPSAAIIDSNASSSKIKSNGKTFHEVEKKHSRTQRGSNQRMIKFMWAGLCKDFAMMMTPQVVINPQQDNDDENQNLENEYELD
jgi:hypothetical protein